MLEEVGKRLGGVPAAAFSFGSCGGHERWIKQDMTIHFSTGEAPPVDLLAATEQLYHETAQELARALKAIRDGRFDEIKATVQVVRDLKAAFQMVMDERGRFDKLSKQLSGRIGSGTLDLDAARDEVGRRLARLRNASGC
jgi:uncharacterized membrane protein